MGGAYCVDGLGMLRWIATNSSVLQQASWGHRACFSTGRGHLGEQNTGQIKEVGGLGEVVMCEPCLAGRAALS